MPTLEVSQLDLNNHAQLVQYEKAMYLAFSSSADQMEGVWTVDHQAGRMAKNIPYGNQLIVAAMWKGELVAAVSVNMDMQLDIQLAEFGFCVEQGSGREVEALALFANKIMVGREILMARVARECNAILKEKSVEVLWASCEKKHLRAYLGVGFVLCEEIMFRGRAVYLLRYVL